MIVIVVIGIVLIATAGVQMYVVRRRNVDPLVRQERAIAALRDVAEHPHPLVADPHPQLPPTRNIRILDEPPADAAARRRRARRAAAARRRAETPMHPANIADRPTAAQLPTRPAEVIHIPSEEVELPAPIPALPSVEIEPTHLREGRSKPHTHAQTGRHPTSRRVKTAAIATTLLVGALAVIVAFAPSGGTTKRNAATSPTLPHAPTPTTTRRVPVTTTTQPASAVQVAAAPGGLSGTVVVAVPYTLMMATSAPCWVSVQTNTGQTLFEGTLLAGQQKELSGAGPLTIRMGNTSGMQMTLNGTRLDLAGMAKTANVQFNPA